MHWPQFSIRELLCVLAYVALGMTALRLGGVVAAITLFVALLMVMAVTIHVFTLHGLRRVQAIGFIVPVAVYALVLTLVGSSEFDSRTGGVAAHVGGFEPSSPSRGEENLARHGYG